MGRPNNDLVAATVLSVLIAIGTILLVTFAMIALDYLLL